MNFKDLCSSHNFAIQKQKEADAALVACIREQERAAKAAAYENIKIILEGLSGLRDFIQFSVGGETEVDFKPHHVAPDRYGIAAYYGGSWVLANGDGCNVEGGLLTFFQKPDAVDIVMRGLVSQPWFKG